MEVVWTGETELESRRVHHLLISVEEVKETSRPPGLVSCVVVAVSMLLSSQFALIPVALTLSRVVCVIRSLRGDMCNGWRQM